jgi:hypothetical protein
MPAMGSCMTAPARTAAVLALSLIVAGATGGCGEKKRTEIILGVATDLDAPDPLTLVSLEVFKLPENIPVAMQPLDISGNVNSVYELPGTFAVYSASGAADRIRVKLTGIRRKNSLETTLVVRTAVMNLVPGRTLFVRLGVVTACIGKLDCGDGLTCIDGECRSENIDSSRLPDYRAGMEREIACAGGTSYVDTSTKQPLTVTGTSCPSGGLCAEGYCLAAPRTDGGQPGSDAADAGVADAGAAEAGDAGAGDAGAGDAARLFGAPVSYPTGAGPTAIALGDLDGDGKPDLAIANRSAANVSVLVNSGSGTFASPINYPAGASPSSIALGDLDGDGRPDLAVGNNFSRTVSVLINGGAGSFAAPVDYPSSNGPFSVVIGDLNGDGRSDIAVANDNDFVSVFLNGGGGTFAAAVNYSSGQAFSMALGDLSGDSRPDLAVAGYGGATVGVLANNGNGTFAAPVSYAAGMNPKSIALGDLNGDGKLDLAAANNGGASVSVLVNNGDGTFASPREYAAGMNPISIAIGDLNGDGKPDLAVANQFGATGNVGNVSVLVNNGDGTFAARRDYDAGANPTAIAIGDLNGDSRLDLAVVDGANVSVLLNIAP